MFEFKNSNRNNLICTLKAVKARQIELFAPYLSFYLKTSALMNNLWTCAINVSVLFGYSTDISKPHVKFRPTETINLE